MFGGTNSNAKGNRDQRDEDESYEDRRQRSRDANSARYDAVTKAMREG